MILFFDTETTGKYDFRARLDAYHQPNLVQLGVLLADEDYNVRARFSAVVKPDGWTIPDDAAAVHGITTEKAAKYGFPIRDVLAHLALLAGPATLRIAHNIQFDDAVLETAFARAKLSPNPFTMLDNCTGRYNGFCTMKAMTNECKLPGNYGDYKWPKLSEAYQHCTGKAMAGAHDAFSDLLACMEIHRWLTTRKASRTVEEAVQ